MGRGDGRRGGFSLMEMLVTAAVLALLAGVGGPVWLQSRESARRVQCVAKMRAMGQAIVLYTQENGGQFPRSLHSAGMYRQPNWAFSLLPYLGVEAEGLRKLPEAVMKQHYRCPSHQDAGALIYSYGMNVHFELDPKIDGRSYAGAPTTWRRFQQLPTPARTILLAETAEHADHFMSHFWSEAGDARGAVAYQRHGKLSNYVFADGHVEMLPLEAVYNPGAGMNLWNPSLAR